jgi:hypothetical protein
MVGSYQGNYSFNRFSISMAAPDDIGVYYCGWVDSGNLLHPLYIGRALGESTSIKSRLLNHLNDSSLEGVTHFGFRACDTATEASDFERQEIAAFNPHHNTQGKPDLSVLLKALIGKS